MVRNDGYRWKVLKLVSMVGIGFLPGSSCTTGLRDGAITGASSFVADATYSLLAGLLPFELTNSGGGAGGGGGGGGGGGDPFGDVPLQM